MELTNREWKEFFIEDVFTIKSGKRLTKADMINGEIPFIGATDSNNGITEFIANKNSSLDKNVLGVNYNGSVVYNFYHSYEAIFSDDVKRLSFKEFEGNKHSFLFVKALILQQKSKYEYGYKFNGERMKRQKILLPVNSKGKPDYEFMESYMQQKEKELLRTYKNHLLTLKPSEKVKSEIEWREFKIGDVFSVSRGKRLIEKNRKKGYIPYYSASATNNGLTDFIQNPLFVEKNCLIVTTFCDSYFIRGKFTASDEITILKNDFLNEFSGKYITNMITSNKNKFAFGYKAFTERITKQIILLPVNSKGQPDYIYMENYIKSLEYEKLKQYLDYKKLNTNN